jgi:hypothetical protein
MTCISAACRPAGAGTTASRRVTRIVRCLAVGFRQAYSRDAAQASATFLVPVEMQRVLVQKNG